MMPGNLIIAAKSALSRFRADRRGVAAVEFAIIAPLLCLMFGISVEIGRLMMAQRQFEAAVVGVARHVASYPEYEIRARDYAKPIVRAMFSAYDAPSFNLRVDSIKKDGGVLKEVFPGHVLFGTNPPVKWQDFVKSADYVSDESVIFVGASYNYRPMFPLISDFPIVLRKTVVILPSFGRAYPWNDKQVADKYVY